MTFQLVHTETLPGDARAAGSILAAVRGYEIRKYPSRAQVFTQGAGVSHVYSVQKGLIKLVRVGPNGSETILGLRAVGGMVGAEEAVSESVHLASAVAATAILVGRAPVSDYLVALRSSGPMAFAMCQILSTQTVAALTHAGRLGGDPAKCRLLSFLAELALSVGPLVGRRITMPIRWWEVAQLVAVTPWHLSRLLRECRREGSLEMGRGWLIIRRDAALVSGMES